MLRHYFLVLFVYANCFVKIIDKWALNINTIFFFNIKHLSLKRLIGYFNRKMQSALVNNCTPNALGSTD